MCPCIATPLRMDGRERERERESERDTHNILTNPVLMIKGPKCGLSC